MRKDVRLGVAVGGLLAVVVLVYAVFFNGGGNGNGGNKGDANADGNVAGRGQQAGAVPAPGPAAPGAPSRPEGRRDLPPGLGPIARQDAGTGRGGSDAATADRPAPTTPTTSTDTDGGRGGGGATIASVIPNVNVPPAPAGGWSWGDLLSRGGGSALRSETPHIPRGVGTPDPDGPGLAGGQTDRTNDPGGATVDPHSLPPAVPPTTDAPPVVVPPPTPPTPTTPTTPTTRPVESGPRKYIVQPGESFWTIAQREYGSGVYVAHLQRANPRINPNRLRANTEIVLPPRSEVVPEDVSDRTLSGGTTPPASLDPARQYRVQQGDNLTIISKKLYGTASKVDAIYELNKDVIGPNKSALKRDVVLVLPEPPTRGIPAAGASAAGTGTAEVN